MDKAEAIKKLEKYYELDKALNSALNELSFVPESEYKNIRLACAEILGQVYFYLKTPIYHEHKDLIPVELRDSIK